MAAHYTTKDGDWGSDTTVRDVLKNPLYTGKINWAKKVYDGQHWSFSPESAGAAPGRSA